MQTNASYVQAVALITTQNIKIGHTTIFRSDLIYFCVYITMIYSS